MRHKDRSLAHDRPSLEWDQNVEGTTVVGIAQSRKDLNVAPAAVHRLPSGLFPFPSAFVPSITL